MNFVSKLGMRAAADRHRVVTHIMTTEHENWLLNYSVGGASDGRRRWRRSPDWDARKRFLPTSLRSIVM